MKYLTYLISLLFVLAFVGCDKTKDTTPEVKKEAVEAVAEEATQTLEEVPAEVEEAIEEVTE